MISDELCLCCVKAELNEEDILPSPANYWLKFYNPIVI